MAGRTIDESGFIADHLEPGVVLPVQCYFLYKVEQTALRMQRWKTSALFHTDHYPLETFYKPIHYPFDITKIRTNDEPAIS
jgi:hypothetical protein